MGKQGESWAVLTGKKRKGFCDRDALDASPIPLLVRNVMRSIARPSVHSRMGRYRSSMNSTGFSAPGSTCSSSHWWLAER
jgi:hypothetical protein